MAILMRKILMAAGVAGLCVALLIAWATRSAWLAYNEISLRQAEPTLNTDHFPNTARALLLRMNQLLLASELPSQEKTSGQADFETLAQQFLAGLEAEASKPRTHHAVQATRLAFERYRSAAMRFLEDARSTAPSEAPWERLQSIREQAEALLLDLSQFSDKQTEELRKVFDEYKSSQDRLYRLVLTLAIVSFLLAGSMLFVVLRNRLAALRLDLARSKLAREKHERLASLGTLASGVAHEIRNPLTAIKTRLFVLEKKGLQDEIAQGQVREIGNEISRLERIVSSFLLFARPPTPDLKNVAIASLIQQVCDLLGDAFSERSIDLVSLCDEDIVACSDEQQVKQILINLAQNAADATPPGGRVEIAAQRASYGSDAPDFRHVAIEVLDYGSGIPEDVSRRLFTPFFTTKAQGTGLGLSIAKRIALENGGDLLYAPNPQGGSIFRLILPAANQA